MTAHAGDVFGAWTAAPLPSGIPSTVRAWLSDGDLTEATPSVVSGTVGQWLSGCRRNPTAWFADLAT